MTEQLAIPWAPNQTWIENGHALEGARLTCGCLVPIPAGHPVLRDGLNWPSQLACPLHGGRHAVTRTEYAKDRGVQLAMYAPKEASE